MRDQYPLLIIYEILQRRGQTSNSHSHRYQTIRDRLGESDCSKTKRSLQRKWPGENLPQSTDNTLLRSMDCSRARSRRKQGKNKNGCIIIVKKDRIKTFQEIVYKNSTMITYSGW